MGNNINGKDLIKLGYKQGVWIGLAMEAIGKMRHSSNKEKLDFAEDVLVNPDNYRDTQYWDKVVSTMYPIKKPTDLREKPVPYKIFGEPIIELGAINQMSQACRLPISIKGAILPDGHAGYGLNIGGVLACDNAVIPYGVGVDISCSMKLTVYQHISFEKHHSQLVDSIVKNTFFGAGISNDKLLENEVIENPLFNSTHLLRSLKDRAAKQLGTSGGGNHFVEWGELTFNEDDLLPKGKYLALLSHSGSRGLGANIANHYTNVAKRLRKLDSSIANLAWLNLDEEEGIEYWEAMNLAGDYAKACHDEIHKRIANSIKLEPILTIGNSHNLAWKEIVDGKELIVHRKGATPAGKGVMGIIPGSMATPGYVVRGKGNESSINSASHGGGRQMSRTKAKETFNWKEVKEDLDKKGIHLISAGIDECMGSYKNIESVMSYQTDLVDIVAKFMPKIVRMAGNDEEPEE